MDPFGIARKRRLSFRLHAVFPKERELMVHLQQLRQRQAAPVLMQLILRAFESQRRGEALPDVQDNWPWLDNPMMGAEEIGLSQRFALGFQNPSPREAQLLLAMQGLTDDRRADVLRSLALRGFAMEQPHWRPASGFSQAFAPAAPVDPQRAFFGNGHGGEVNRTMPAIRPVPVPLRTPQPVPPKAKKPAAVKKAETTAGEGPKTTSPKWGESAPQGAQVGDNEGRGLLSTSVVESRANDVSSGTTPPVEFVTSFVSPEVDAAEIPDSIPEAISSGDAVGESVQVIPQTSQVEIIQAEPMSAKSGRANANDFLGLKGMLLGGAS